MKHFWSFFHKKANSKGGEYANEKYSALYSAGYPYFLNFLIKQETEDILTHCNYKIADFVSEYAYDPISGIPGIHRWLDGMSKDVHIYNIEHKTIEVREATHSVFSKKIEAMVKSKHFFECEISKELTEAIFLKNSLTFYIGAIKEGFNPK